MEQLGNMYISSELKSRGHEVKLFIGSDDKTIEQVSLYEPLIVGFSCVTGFEQKWLKMASRLKEKLGKVLVLMGGPHPTFFPQVIEHPAVDVICRGEGELAAAELADAVANEKDYTNIKNLWVKKDGKVIENELRELSHPDELLFPDRELSFEYDFIRNDPNIHFIAGRGCPYGCAFCYSPAAMKLYRGKGKYLRWRSVASTIEELIEVKKHWDMKVAYFQDDTFAIDPEWLYPFLEAYESEVKVPLYCTIRADTLTEDIARRLKAAGCYRVSFGVESGVEHIRMKLLKKKVTDAQIVSAANILKKVGIPFQTTNMIGLPGETLDQAIETIKFNIRIGADVAWGSIYQPYPETPLGEFALKQGYIKDFSISEKDADAHGGSILDQPQIRELENLHKFIYLAFKAPFLIPLIKRLVKLRPNPLFTYIHRITYLLFYFSKITKMPFRRTLSEAWVALKHYR